MTDDARTAEQWGQAYATARAGHTAFSQHCESLLLYLLSDAGIGFSQMEARTKSVDSFVGKIQRKDDKYANPLRDITDLVGIRIVARGPADLERIGALIEEHFVVDWDNSRRQTGPVDPDRFGYRSDHYVVRLLDQRLALPEYGRFRDHVAEIQVRTVMQHAWAVYDHRLRYKNPAQLPDDLRRRLFRLSAMLEIVDDEFGRLAQAADELEATYAAEVEQGDYSAKLDLLSLDAFIHKTEVLERWAETARGLGYLRRFRERGHEREQLAATFEAVGIRDLAAVNDFFAAAPDWGEGYLKALRDEIVARRDSIYAQPYDVLTFLVLRASPDDAAIEATVFRQPIKDALRAVRAAAEV